MGSNDFESVWERVKEVTGWKLQRELADFLHISSQSISGAKARGVFPINWAVSIARNSQVDAEWLMTGNGEPSSSREVTVETRRDLFPDNYRYQDSPDSFTSGLKFQLIKEIDHEGDSYLRTTFDYMIHLFHRAIYDFEKSNGLEYKLKKAIAQNDKLQKELERYKEIERNHPELFEESNKPKAE